MLRSAEDESFLVNIEEGLLRLTFNRPDAGNALPPSSIPLLTNVFEAAREDRAVGCLLIEGRGANFSAGGDVKGFSNSTRQPRAERQADFDARLGRLASLVQAVVEFDKPVVVAMRGAAAGAGLLYPLAADVVLGDPTAQFLFAHRRIGLSPDAGVSYLLPRIVGDRRARTLLLTAARVKAEEALGLGLLSRIVDADDLDAAATILAKELAQGPMLAMRNTKRLARAAPDAVLQDHLQAERAALVACVGDDDFVEGVGALVDRRAPRFGGAASPSGS